MTIVHFIKNVWNKTIQTRWLHVLELDMRSGFTHRY